MRRNRTYPLERSPLSQKIKWKELAKLMRFKESELKGLLKYKQRFVTEREAELNGKKRTLIYPVGRLRTFSERIKLIFERITAPSYVFSPRKGVAQKHNAKAHVNSEQVLKLDIKQFYPSITKNRIISFFKLNMAMYDDVAYKLADLLTSNGKVFFGGPATPVLVRLVCGPMFDEIDRLCKSRDLVFTLWVDNLTISGKSLSGEVIEKVRDIIARYGFKSHEIQQLTTNRYCLVTGLDISRFSVKPSNASNLAIRDLESSLRTCGPGIKYDQTCLLLLSRLGYQLSVIEKGSVRYQKIQMRMNSIRQKRRKNELKSLSEFSSDLPPLTGTEDSSDDVPWD